MTFKNEYNKVILNFIFFYILFNFSRKNTQINGQSKKREIKVALCTMGRKENLYAKEFIEYYIKLGIDHMFIYDDNPPLTEKIQDVIDEKYMDKISIYEAKKQKISNQIIAFTSCYKNNLNEFDWFIMVDMDEYLYIVNDTLKNYLTNKIFDKCDFIKIHWANSQDNGLLYYDPRPLFTRFKKPYIKSKYIKSIIRGNITNLKYYVHSPYISPDRNITCDNEGNVIKYKNMNFQFIDNININKSYLIHFRFKSTEELINKMKRGYSNWHKNHSRQIMIERITSYFEENKITLEKINFIEKELKLNLSSIRNMINKTNITNKFE